MTRLVAGLCAALAGSATCGGRPQPMPWDLPPLDAGTAEDGGALVLGPDCRPCDSWGAVEIRGPLPAALDELSGLAVSFDNPGVLYAHNDSGDTARLFALDTFGRLLAELRLPGVRAVDWEDMALGPCGDDAGTCLFLGDIGDNLRRRRDYAVYRAREPALKPSQAPTELTVAFDRLPFVYPGGARHDAETLLSHPVTGELYVLTRETAGSPARVYAFPRPLTPDTTVTLVELGSASVPTSTDVLPTGGAIHPCGRSLLVRLYNRIVELRAEPDAGFESAFRAEPLEVPSAIDEPQGEAVAWGTDGQSYFTASEQTGQSLHQVRCVRSP